jgi:glycosyltransferase involved in cell wall biosynthesis
VLDVFRELRHQKRDARLILAGPTDTDAERRLIEAARIEFGERFDYRGPVYGAEKQKFFRDIHAKIYPTRLDAQPLVIMEAFANGRPVISYARGCIPEMIPCPEWLIDPGDHFVQHAVEQLIRWIDDRTAYGQACRLARQAYETSCQEARTALDNFVRWVCNEATSGFVYRGANRLMDAPPEFVNQASPEAEANQAAIKPR